MLSKQPRAPRSNVEQHLVAMQGHSTPDQTIFHQVDRFATRQSEAPLVLAIACVGADVSRLETCVPMEERVRAARFRMANDRTLYLAARATLRMVLGRIFLVDGVHVPLHYSNAGKPLVRNGPSFSISHSGGVALIGLAWGTEIGVDVEVMRPLPDLQSLAASCLAATELGDLRRIDCTDRRAVQLLSIWVRKEAISKALGLGLALPFDSFSCRDGEGPMVIGQEGAAVAQWPWTVMDLALPAPHIGAVAIAAKVSGCTVIAANAKSIPSSRQVASRF
jgi:4'-phosphopantetheinyl transferase